MEIVGAVVGVLGLIFVMLQYFGSQNSDRVKLKVVPVSVFGVGDMEGLDTVGIGVTNLSQFPVVIKEIGFILQESDMRRALLNPILLDGGRFPRRLGPRTAFTVYFAPGEHLSRAMADVKTAYATTECGTTVNGTSKALKGMISRAQP